MDKDEVEKKYLNHTIIITEMLGEDDYNGRTGRVTHVDDALQLHGTWGSLAVILDSDKVEILD